MTTIIYTSPVTSTNVYKETKDNYKKIPLSYVIHCEFSGKNLLTVDLLPFVKDGKKAIDPYFSLVIDGNYNVSMTIGKIPNSKGYLNKSLKPIVNLSETVINHWLSQPVINNNGNVIYLETYLLAYAVLPLIKQSVTGKFSKAANERLGYGVRLDKLNEYELFKAWNDVYSTCPLTQAILSACRDHFQTLTAPIVEEKQITQETIDQHQNLADNKPEVNPVSRSDNSESEPLPPLTTFDQGVDMVKQLTDKFNANPESLKQEELLILAHDLGLTKMTTRNSKKDLQNAINAKLTVTV